MLLPEHVVKLALVSSATCFSTHCSTCRTGSGSSLPNATRASPRKLGAPRAVGPLVLPGAAPPPLLPPPVWTATLPLAAAAARYPPKGAGTTLSKRKGCSINGRYMRLRHCCRVMHTKLKLHSDIETHASEGPACNHGLEQVTALGWRLEIRARGDATMHNAAHAEEAEVGNQRSAWRAARRPPGCAHLAERRR